MGDGETQLEAIQEVKSAFECYIEVALKNKEIIPEPIDIEKSKRINVSLTKRIAGLDSFAENLHTDRSKILAALTDLLLEGKIYIENECNNEKEISDCFVNISLNDITPTQKQQYQQIG